MLTQKAFGIPMDVHILWTTVVIFMFYTCDFTTAALMSLTLPATIASMVFMIRFSSKDMGDRDID